MKMDTTRGAAHPTFAEAFRFWAKLGFISFGGPAGQIAIEKTDNTSAQDNPVCWMTRT